jgi:hypothetical protein
MRLGARPGDQHRFVAQTSFAEYVELPGLGAELRVTLASYRASCDEYVPPEEGEGMVTVVTRTPQGIALTPGVYPWAGHDAHGGVPPRPERPYAVPTVRVGRKSFLIQPGGALELTRVELSRDGRIAGLLKFESSGDESHEATSVRGRFDVSLCRFQASQSEP